MNYLTSREQAAFTSAVTAFDILTNLLVVSAMGALVLSEAAWYTAREAVESGRIVRGWYNSFIAWYDAEGCQVVESELAPTVAAAKAAWAIALPVVQNVPAMVLSLGEHLRGVCGCYQVAGVRVGQFVDVYLMGV